MALALRVGLFRYGCIHKAIHNDVLFRPLGTQATSRANSSQISAKPAATPTSDLKESLKPKSNINCFPSAKLKDTVNEEFKKTQSRVLTFPNVLTFSRMATAPAMGYFIWNGMHSYALACFAYAAVTDLLDGFIARKFNQSSDLGGILDPLADKLLLTTCFIAMYNVDMIPLWVVKGFVFRDLVIVSFGSVMRYFGLGNTITLKRFFDFKNYPTLGFEPSLLSKCNTALQCLLIIVHLSTHHLVGIPSYDWSIFGLQAVTMATTTVSLGQYTARALSSNTFSTNKANRLKG